MNFLGTIKLEEKYMYGHPILALIVEGKVCAIGPITGSEDELFNMYSFVAKESLEGLGNEELISLAQAVLEVKIFDFQPHSYKEACENMIHEIEKSPTNAEILSVETIGGGPIVIDNTKLLQQLKNYILICG